MIGVTQNNTILKNAFVNVLKQKNVLKAWNLIKLNAIAYPVNLNTAHRTNIGIIMPANVNASSTHKFVIPDNFLLPNANACLVFPKTAPRIIIGAPVNANVYVEGKVIPPSLIYNNYIFFR